MEIARAQRRLYAVGPVIAAAFVALAIAGNSGPGFFALALVSLALFGAVVPLVQFGLSRTSWFSKHPFIGCAFALFAAVGAIAGIAARSAFNQW